MEADEQLIRNLITEWQNATAAGDLAKILTLMDEDVVFLLPGQAPMRGRNTFAAGFQTALQHFRIESRSEIQEIKVAGEWAYCWNRLWVTMTPLKTGSPMRRNGYTLTILRKKPDGHWVLSRDANLLAAESSELA